MPDSPDAVPADKPCSGRPLNGTTDQELDLLRCFFSPETVSHPIDEVFPAGCLQHSLEAGILGRTFEFLQRLLGGIDPEAVLDFLEKNREGYPERLALALAMKPSHPGGRESACVSDAPASRASSVLCDTMALSRVGFNRDVTQALCFARGGWDGIPSTWAMYIMFRAEGGQWRAAGHVAASASGAVEMTVHEVDSVCATRAIVKDLSAMMGFDVASVISKVAKENRLHDLPALSDEQMDSALRGAFAARLSELVEAHRSSLTDSDAGFLAKILAYVRLYAIHRVGLDRRSAFVPLLISIIRDPANWSIAEIGLPEGVESALGEVRFISEKQWAFGAWLDIMPEKRLAIAREALAVRVPADFTHAPPGCDCRVYLSPSSQNLVREDWFGGDADHLTYYWHQSFPETVIHWITYECEPVPSTIIMLMRLAQDEALGPFQAILQREIDFMRRRNDIAVSRLRRKFFRK